MQLTTPQLYALFGILAAAAFLIGLSYMTGLRTGRKAGETVGRELAEAEWMPRTKEKDSIIDNLLDQIERTWRQISAAQMRIEELIAYPTPLTAADVKTLIDSQKNLDLTNGLLDEIKCHGFARTGRACVINLQGLMSRINQKLEADRTHPDTVLIDWLDENAHIHFDLENATLTFLSSPGPTGWENVRALLRQAKQDSEEIERNHGEGLQQAAAQLATAREASV